MRATLAYALLGAFLTARCASPEDSPAPPPAGAPQPPAPAAPASQSQTPAPVSSAAPPASVAEPPAASMAERLPRLPDPARLPPIPDMGFAPPRPIEEVRAAYQFAALHPEVMRYVPCFCGCERNGHQDNEDCFVRARAADGTVTWEPHGVG
ncbi:MAG: PCYCGC motif-containing (lipo)protein [Vicinamibacterales bacterium]